jgi:hypothetical protein
MSDAEAPIVESKATPEIRKQAEQLGWIPPERFKGDPARYVDADLYLERGETILPIVREHNKRLHGEVAALKAQNTEIQQALKVATTAIAEIEERHTVSTQKAVERAKEQVIAQLAAASEAGDHEAHALLTSKLVDLQATSVTPVKPVVTPAAPAAFVPPPDLAEWNAENPWFGKDKRKTALALGIAQELREGGETSTGRAFFDKVSAEMEVTLPSGRSTEPAPSKVEGGANGSGGDTRASARGGKSYNDLPSEAKAACDADSERFVGAKKQYKTVAEWRARYAEIYFE